MRLLIFQNYFTPYRAALYSRLAELGHDVKLVYFQRPEDESRRWGDGAKGPLNFEIFQCRRIIILKLVFSWVPVKAVVQMMRSDFVLFSENTPTNVSMILYAALCRLFRRPGALWVEYIVGRPGSRAVQWFERATFRLLQGCADSAFALSRKTAVFVKQYSPRAAIHLLPQAVPGPSMPTPRRLRDGSQGVVFGYLGSNEPRKNLGSLLAAVQALRTGGGDCRLVVAGVDRLPGPQDGVECLGYVDGLRREEFFAQIDFLVLPSIHDSWGMVCNEALLRGALPIASTGCGASEMCGDIDPRLVIGTTPEAIAEGLAKCVRLFNSSPEETLARAQEVSKGYTIQTCADALVEAINGTLRRRA